MKQPLIPLSILMILSILSKATPFPTTLFLNKYSHPYLTCTVPEALVHGSFLLISALHFHSVYLHTANKSMKGIPHEHI